MYCVGSALPIQGNRYVINFINHYLAPMVIIAILQLFYNQ